MVTCCIGPAVTPVLLPVGVELKLFGRPAVTGELEMVQELGRLLPVHVREVFAPTRTREGVAIKVPMVGVTAAQLLPFHD